jgi:hypothetical protein
MADGKVIFSKNDGSYINEKEANQRKERYIKEQNERGNQDPIRSQFYGSDMLAEMIKRNASVGVRISFGLNEDGTPNLVLDALDEYGNVILKDTSGLKDDPDSHGSNGPVCPLQC